MILGVVGAAVVLVLGLSLFVASQSGAGSQGSASSSTVRGSALPGTSALPGHLLDYVEQSDLAHTVFGAQSEPALDSAANAICDDHWIAPSDFTNLSNPITPLYMVLAGTGWLDEYDWPAMTAGQAQEFINAAVTTECPDQMARIH